MIGFLAAVLVLGDSTRRWLCPHNPEWPWCDHDVASDEHDVASDESFFDTVDVRPARDCALTNWLTRQHDVEEFNRLVNTLQTSSLGREMLKAFQPLEFPDTPLLDPPLRKGIFGYEFEFQMFMRNIEVVGMQNVTILPTNVTGDQNLEFGFSFPRDSFQATAQIELHLTQLTKTGCVAAPAHVREALRAPDDHSMTDPILEAPAVDNLESVDESQDCVQACFLSWFPGLKESHESLDDSTHDSSYDTALEAIPTCPPRVLPLNVTLGLHDFVWTSNLYLELLECTPEAKRRFGKVCSATSLEALTRASLTSPEAMDAYVAKLLSKIREMHVTDFDATFNAIDVARVIYGGSTKKRFLNVFLKFVTSVMRQSANSVPQLRRALERALTQAGFENTNGFIDFEYRDGFGDSCI